MIIKRLFAALTAGALLTAVLLSNISAKPDKENLLFLGDDLTAGKNADAASIEMISDYLGVTLTNDTASELTSSQCLGRMKNKKADIENADTIVLSIGFFDFVTPFLDIIYSYREGDESFNEVKEKMKKNLSAVIAQFSDILNSKDTVIDTTTKAIEEIKKINPDAELYYLCCYNPFNAYTNDSTYILLNGQINRLLSEFYLSIDSIEGVKCIDLNTAFSQNEGSYTNVLNYDVYPSTAGQLKIASTLLTNKTGENEDKILTDLVTSKFDRTQIDALPAVIKNNITLPAETTTTTPQITTTEAVTTTPKSTTVVTTTTPKVTTVTTTTTPKVTTVTTTTTTTPKETTVTTTTTPKVTTVTTTTTPKMTTVTTTTTAPKVTTASSSTEAVEYLKGDINKDGTINAADFLKLKKIILSNISEAEKAQYDLTNDAKTDVSDLVYFIKLLA